MHFQELKATTYTAVSPYGYTPDAWIGILFIVLFALSTIFHLVQAIRYRLWWLLFTVVLAGIMELIGHGARLWSSYNIHINTPYLIQIVCTILAPTPLVAASFITLGQVIHRLGQQYSRLSARWYTIVFISCDIIALIIQALGGASADAAVNQNKSAKPGGNTMLGGIIFQTVAITFYMLLATEFVFRYLYNKPIGGRPIEKTGYTLDSKTKQMVGALAFSSACIYVRSWYRTVELANGWQGYIIRTQRYFVIMDALMIVFAMWIMNIFHPGRLLGPAPAWKFDQHVGSEGETRASEESSQRGDTEKQ
ncbi:RTA1-domain-containing protein [Rhodofomes roseus]|uniref:RTA1-domain-containing protein n=1 Tax=Rhodofomes roseus TaxID=34475 RepID=A0ABQ8KX36_9APHY|nr:RTA1-domain-containing protein [Rhodofomes roseus]KAH9843099.1 RTA1-domain-containing protein [Rhodofomes roseus]